MITDMHIATIISITTTTATIMARARRTPMRRA